MAKNALIPPLVRNDIVRYIQRNCKRAQEGFIFSNQDEDTVTGDFLGKLSFTNWHNINGGGKDWRWKINYRKFRGRGPGAFENVIGADGIIQIVLNDRSSREFKRKGLLFQAKMSPLYFDNNIIAQANLMENIAPGNSAMFIYSSSGYQFQLSKDYLSRSTERIQICEALIQFVSCKYGAEGLYFDYDSELLKLADGSEMTTTSPKDSMEVEIETTE
jgi:hypothetical protein